MPITKPDFTPREALAMIERDAMDWMRRLDRGGAVTTDELINVLQLIARLAAEARGLVPNP